MDFESALKAMREGKKATRPCFVREEATYCFILNDYGIVVTGFPENSLDSGSDREVQNAILGVHILAKDWEIVE